MFALAMTLLSPACQDPQYGDLSNPSEGNSGGADSSTARTSPRDAAAAGKPDSRASATGTDGGNRSGDDRGPTGRESVTQSDASDDNKPPIEESADAGGPVVSAVPKWAKPLTGRYATRSFAFKQDQYGTVVRAEQLGIVEFALEGTGMVLRSKTCVSLADNSTAQLRLIDPASLPERVEQVVFSELERSWSTVGSTYLVGFMRQPTPSCEGKQGQSVAKAEAQVWLTGSTCRCVLAAEKPTRDDCRVLDPDHDKKPGVSYMLKGFTSTLLDGTLYGAVESDTHYVGGKVGAVDCDQVSVALGSAEDSAEITNATTSRAALVLSGMLRAVAHDVCARAAAESGGETGAKTQDRPPDRVQLRQRGDAAPASFAASTA
jgi:hypothetical protein